MANRQTQTPAGHKAQRAARKPGPVQVLQATPAGAMAAVAQVLAKAPAAAAAAAPAAAPAAAAAPATTAQVLAPTPGLHGGVPLANLPRTLQARGPGVGKVPAGAGGLVVRMGTKPCKVAAGHNLQWWAGVQATLQANKGQSSMAQLMAAQVPGHFVTYAVRNGWLAKVA